MGDWRDPITLRMDALTDPVERTAFYVERGLNTELTDFPEEAFHSGLSLAGVTEDLPALIAKYGPPAPLAATGEDEQAFMRTNKAHERLLRFESQIRQFIEFVMTKAFGDKWMKQQLPKGMLEKWMEKKEKTERTGGQPWPLIAYADFTDYEPIICNKGNWKAFEPFFGRMESVRESLQRLYPIRICTMHARLITKDDELFLFVETKRLTMAIQKNEINVH